MAVWRVLLNLSITLLPTSGVVGIDASGFDRSHASKHYTKRTKLTIQQLKVTLLVDTRANDILDLHVTTTRKHDSHIAPSLIKRDAENVAILLGDKGYDDQKVRALARDAGVRPLDQAPRIFVALQGVECSTGRRPLRPTESERDSELSSQTEIWRICPLTTLVEAVP
jgi:IS5 family transposase